MKRKTALMLTESAVMIALAIVLDFIKIINMPFGGSVTACSMLPILLIAYRWNLKTGMLTALVFSLLQMVLGIETIRDGTSAAAVIAIILLDYIIAFAVLGLGGVFRNVIKDQSAGLICGALLACSLRYICHVISGCTVWVGVSIPTSDGLVYSLAYNAAYMVPETIVVIAGAWYVGRVIDFRGEKLAALHRESEPVGVAVCKAIGMLALVVGIVFDALYAFAKMQTEEGFDITGISGISVPLFISVLAGGIVLFAVLFGVARALNRQQN